MGSALSWSLAAHAAFIVSFLLLSATRQPLPLPHIARSVRLVTYLEPAAAPRSKAAAPLPRVIPLPAEPLPAEPRLVQPQAAPIPAATAEPSLAVAVPRVAIPVREQERTDSRAPAPTTGERAALSERLARRLAATAPTESRPAENAAPRIAGLPPPEFVAPAPSPDRTGAPPPATPPGAIVPVGYFPHSWYLAILQKMVFADWSPPSEFFQSSRPPAVLVSFRIDRGGTISGITLKESSGSARFDKSALAAVQGLGQVPALPEQYLEESLDVVIRFQNQK